ncbi:MAG: hypothetical protein WCR55_14970 [Lentisphaerota bacterium]
MKKIKSLISFRRFKDLELTEISQTIINKLTDNAYYPSPTPSLDILQAASQDYSESLAKCKFGSKEDTAIKNEKRYFLEKHLSTISNYVNSIADGNIAKLESSGFPLTSPPQKIGILSAPAFIKISEGENPGEVYFNISLIKKAASYKVAYALAPTSPDTKLDWQEKLSSSHTGWISGLESGKKYSFKATATSPEANSLGLYNFTAPVEKFIS